MKKINKTLLVITDGIGFNKDYHFNAFEEAKKEAYPYLFKHAPHSLISTYGQSVGLPAGQMGNSEVGHMCIGSGRVLYQDLVKISLSLEDGTIQSNEVLKELQATSKRIHLVALMSDGGVHSHIEHMIGIANILSQDKQVFLHLISDGRDVSPTSSRTYLAMLQERLHAGISIATLGGRFYTMDRDKRWERVERGYRAIVEATPRTSLTPNDYVASQYQNEITDEFIEPIAFGDYEGMEDGDGVAFLNFRSDRMREIVTALGDSSFSEFATKPLQLGIATMTRYDENFDYPVLFKKELPTNTLAEVIAKAGLRQLHTAETEKYAHVTFFLNGGVEEPFENETRVLVPSPKVKTYDMQPEMSAQEVGDVVLKAMDEAYEFIVVNFANGDMVGHTGNFEAGIKAVEAVDRELMRILNQAKECDYKILLTSDHGNCEKMRDEQGNTLTNHTVGDVWCFVVAEDVKEINSGGLNNIAPTVLKMMGLDIPKEMDKALY